MPLHSTDGTSSRDCWKWAHTSYFLPWKRTSMDTSVCFWPHTNNRVFLSADNHWSLCICYKKLKIPFICSWILGSIVVSIPACHAGDRGSIPRRGGRLFLSFFFISRGFLFFFSSSISLGEANVLIVYLQENKIINNYPPKWIFAEPRSGKVNIHHFHRHWGE